MRWVEDTEYEQRVSWVCALWTALTLIAAGTELFAAEPNRVGSAAAPSNARLQAQSRLSPMRLATVPHLREMALN